MNASDKYKEIQKEIEANIELLKQKLELHKNKFDYDNGNWGYVGDISYINTQLSNMVDSVKYW